MHKIKKKSLRNLYKFFLFLTDEPICHSACDSSKNPPCFNSYIWIGNHVYVKSLEVALGLANA